MSIVPDEPSRGRTGSPSPSAPPGTRGTPAKRGPPNRGGGKAYGSPRSVFSRDARPARPPRDPSHGRPTGCSASRRNSPGPSSPQADTSKGKGPRTRGSPPPRSVRTEKANETPG